MNQQMQELTAIAEQGSADAQHQLGEIYLGRDTSVADHSQALSWLRKAAEQGHKEAEQLLGKAYFELGRAYYTNDSPHKAIAMLILATEHHYTPAYRGLASIYTLGATGLDRCLVTVVKMLKEGAILGDVDCQYELGCSLLDKSRSANDQHAIDGIKWLTIAGMQDHKPAQLMLAEIYQDNEYAKPDSQMVLFWHSKAQMNQQGIHK